MKMKVKSVHVVGAILVFALLCNTAHAGAADVIANAIWYANLLLLIPFFIGSIVALVLKNSSRLRRNFSFIMGVMNILLGVASVGYWLFVRISWAIPFLLPILIGIYIFFQVYKNNTMREER